MAYPYHGDDRFRYGAYLLLHVEHIEARYTVGAYIASVAFYVHVAARAEGFVAGTGQHHYVDVLTFTAVQQGVAYFGCGGRGEGVAVTRAVDGYLGYSVIIVEKNILVFFDGFPFSGL